MPLIHSIDVIWNEKYEFITTSTPLIHCSLLFDCGCIILILKCQNIKLLCNEQKRYFDRANFGKITSQTTRDYKKLAEALVQHALRHKIRNKKKLELKLGYENFKFFFGEHIFGGFFYQITENFGK